MTRIGLLDEASKAITVGADPDGPDVRAALMLAVDTSHAAVVGGSTDSDRWSFAAAALAEAADRLTESLATTYVLTVEPVPPALVGAPETLAATRALVTSLANFYVQAASDEAWSAWRRLVWADVANHLDRAAAELA